MSKGDKTVRASDRRGIERAMLRALRVVWPLDRHADAGELPKSVQVELIGLERARRRLGGKHA